MRTLLPSLAASAFFATAALAQATWTQLPLPPGGWGGFSRAIYGGEFPLAQSGGLVHELRNGTWNTLPLPPNATSLPNSAEGSYIAACGPRPLACTNLYSELYEWNGTAWTQLPFPPGLGSAHPMGTGTTFLEGGRRHLVATSSLGLLHEFDGTNWVPLPMPPGETAVPSATADAIPGSSDRHTFYVDGGTAMVEWDGTAWIPVPLPPGVTDVRASILPIRNIGSFFMARAGRCGAHMTMRRDANSYWLRRNGTWEVLTLPPGVSGFTSVAYAGCRSQVLLWTGPELWSLATPTRDQWSEVPLPPGVTTDAASALTYGAGRPLALTNGGAELWELRGTSWSSLPLPSGLPAIGQSTFSALLPSGRHPLLATNFHQDLAEWRNGQWQPMPLPPGAPYVGGFSGSQILDCGARPLATTHYGNFLHEWNGSQWAPLPLPPGVAQVHPVAGVVAVPGDADRHTLSTGFGTGLVAWDGTQWNPIPLPDGVTSLGGEVEVQPRPLDPFVATVGRAGGHLTLTLGDGATMVQWIDGQWQELRFPNGSSARPGNGTTIARGSRTGMLVATDGGTRLWSRANRFADVEATSACAGASSLQVTGAPVLGGSLTLSGNSPTPTWFTGFAVDGPATLPMCSCPGLWNATWVYGPYTLTIPNDPQFLGIELYGQGIDFVVGTTTCDLPPPAALTDVLRFVIG